MARPGEAEERTFKTRFWLEDFCRELRLSADSVTLRMLWGERRIAWAEISQVTLVTERPSSYRGIRVRQWFIVIRAASGTFAVPGHCFKDGAKLEAEFKRRFDVQTRLIGPGDRAASLAVLLAALVAVSLRPHDLAAQALCAAGLAVAALRPWRSWIWLK